MESLWELTAMPPHFPALDRDIDTDILIIGGGICGLLCAHRLQQAGADYTLVEADALCGGITKNTTAKITVQHGLIYHRLIQTYGKEKARQYLLANQAALSEYGRLCGQLDCDYVQEDGYVYVREKEYLLRREMEALQALGVQAECCRSLPLPFSVAGGIRHRDQGRVHPLKLAYGLSKGLHIYEHTRVRQLAGLKAVTDGGVIRAKRIIAATHFPFLNKHGSYFLKLYQHRSYVLVLRDAPQPEGMFTDADPAGMSFRNDGDLLLLGGGGHRTGKQGGGWQELREFAARHYPRAKACLCWATQDCMSLDGVPYIGPYSARTEGLYVAAGFNKWGMTSAMAAAMLLTDMMQGKDNPCSPVFSPSRSILHPQLAINIWESAVDLLTPTLRRCPHLGCALQWNPIERSWDCPCHGSRFSESGRLLDNPATGDLKGERP